jgi:PAS domain-containing protein
MRKAQQPIEMVLARSLMSNLITPAFLVDEEGSLVFYNDAAGELLGLRFEEAGRMPAEEWGTRFEPLDLDGQPIAVDNLPLVIALRSRRPVHSTFRVRSAIGDERCIEVSAIPIVSAAGTRGAMAIFWDVDADG